MKILVICPSRSSIRQALELADGLRDHDFTIYTEYLPLSLEGSRGINWQFCSALSQVLGRVPGYDLLVTFGSTSNPSHRIAFMFSVLFGRLGRRRVDIQHGLYQEGYTIPIGAETLLCDHLASWEEFGHLLPKVSMGRRAKSAVGICTNLHWEVYSEQERSLFRRAVAEVSRQFPDKTFLWRAHPAEFTYKEGRFPVFETAGVVRSNIYVQTFRETDEVDISEFMSSVGILITTPSTTLLDGWRSNTPTLCFHAEALNEYPVHAGHPTYWRTPGDLVYQMKNAHSLAAPSAEYKGFDFEKFAKWLEPLPDSAEGLSVEAEITLAFELAHNFGCLK